MRIDNLNDTLELFGQIGGRGNENCVFFANKDQAGITESGTLSKAVVGEVANRLTCGLVGEIAEMANGSNYSIGEFQRELNLDVLDNYTQFLINETEDTIAVIPIRFKSKLHYKVNEVQLFPENGRVIPKSIIEKITINKFSFLTPTIRGLQFKLLDGYKVEFMVATNLKTLPYHIGNFKIFNSKYANKK